MQQSWISLNSKETLKYLVGELNYNFSISNGFTQFVNFPTRLPDCDSHRTVTLTVLLFWIYLFLLMLVFVLQWLSLHWEILIMLLSQFPLILHQIHNGMPVSLHSLWLFSCWLGWSLWSFERCSMGGYL